MICFDTLVRVSAVGDPMAKSSASQIESSCFAPLSFLNLRFFTAFAPVVSAATLLLVAGAALARPAEPAKLDPLKDAEFIATLGLASKNWSDDIINILVVGQDGVVRDKKNPRYTRPNGEVVANLASHADGNMLLSFNRSTGQISIISLYRGYIVHDEHWVDVEDAPAASSSEVLTPRYLANYYRIAGRAKYLSYARSAFESFIRARKLEKQFFAADAVSGTPASELRIHGLVETGFSGFKVAMGQFVESFSSSARVAWALRGHAGTLFEIFRNRDALMSALREQDGYQAMTETRKADVDGDPERAILGSLRERQSYAGGGYQRAFNHAKFITYVMGLVAYTMAEADVPDFLKEPAIAKTFETFSRTFPLETFDKNLRLRDRKLHILARAGFNRGESPVYLIQIGTSVSNFAVYQAGKYSTTGAKGFLAGVDPKVQLIPKPNDCPACRPR